MSQILTSADTITQARKLVYDIGTGTALGEVNNATVNTTLILNIVLILGRLALEYFERRKQKRKQK